MTGDTKDAVRLLIDSCSENIDEVVKLAVEFNIEDDHLWDQIIARSKGDVGRVSTILQYADIYRDPARFIDALDDDIEIEQISDSLVGAIKSLKSQRTILETALDTSHDVKEKLEFERIREISTGFCSINTVCKLCHDSLVPAKVLEAEGIRNPLMSSLEGLSISDELMPSLVVFKCGHNFHKRCLVSEENRLSQIRP
jgi:hypothetical protein